MVLIQEPLLVIKSIQRYFKRIRSCIQKQTTQSIYKKNQNYKFKSAKVFDLEGKEIPKGSKDMGGKENR